ncbi:MAG: hypothetical protein IJG18_09275 [Kiritimatiellae bacterium]|nr:hypothetical protein [Kiritimatiellia bacterium]
MKLRNFSPIVISLLVGAALGYCLGPLSSPAPAPEPEQKAEPEQVKQTDQRDHGDRAANRALRARIKELEDMLAKQGVEVEKMKEEETARRDRGPRNWDFRADMERLKKEEPERYAQITNSMAQFRQRRLERAQSKIDFLSSVDTSRMSPAMLKVHSELQDMIEKREAVEEKMREFMDMTEEERREAFREIGEIDGKIRELNRAERDNLLVQTAEALGFQGDDAAEIIDTVKSIYEATDSGWGWGGPGGGGRRGGRGGHGGRGGNR